MLKRLSLCALIAIIAAANVNAAEKASGKDVSPLLNFKMKDIDGKEVCLSKYQGKVVMFVNVASQCGLTKHYKGLQALHDKYADKGLAIVGFPANNFGAQEPGTNLEIKQFCTSRYDVKFDMMSKVSVKGGDKCDLYKVLTSKQNGGDIKWNFEKFVIGRDGKIAKRFSPRTTPESKAIVSVIEAELAKK